MDKDGHACTNQLPQATDSIGFMDGPAPGWGYANCMEDTNITNIEMQWMEKVFEFFNSHHCEMQRNSAKEKKQHWEGGILGTKNSRGEKVYLPLLVVLT